MDIRLNSVSLMNEARKYIAILLEISKFLSVANNYEAQKTVRNTTASLYNSSQITINFN